MRIRGNMLSISKITEGYIALARQKVKDSIPRTLLLSILSGVFIAFAGVGCCFATHMVNAFVGALVFPAGIVMVVVGGSKLFTGDCLLTLPLLTGDVKVGETAKTLALVYLGNLIGSLIVVGLMIGSGVLDSVKEAVIETAVKKSSIPFGEALVRGILCNVLVCIAVWLSYSTENVAGKILAMYLPILVFVIAGFEHSVANMYFLPAGIFTALRYGITENMSVMLTGLYANMIPVTLGNMIGGALVAIMYRYTAYTKPSESSEDKADIE